eukprot:1366502-Heterocapsa_arctica.AAC.1
MRALLGLPHRRSQATTTIQYNQKVPPHVLGLGSCMPTSRAILWQGPRPQASMLPIARGLDLGS